MSRLIAAWALLAVLMGAAPAATRDPYKLTPVINAFRFDGVDATIEWKTCGQVNAFYQPWDHRVVLCNELKAYSPGVIRYILAHELSHATIMQRSIPYTGSHEWAADELAGLWLIIIGHEDDVMEGAEFWYGLGRDENPYDDHPGDTRRALNLACLVWTHQEVPSALAGCNTQFKRVNAAWNELLGISS